MSRDTNFYYSFLVLPPSKRRAIIAVWDFCRAVDDAVDAPAPVGVGQSAGPATSLEQWRHELGRCYSEEPPQTCQGQQLKPYVAQFALPRQPFDDLIDGVSMDLGTRRYETFEDLYEYCIRVASAVGLICIEIFGYRNKRTRDYAVALGVALQLTNIIRDVPSDLARGRIYLPTADLRRYGCRDEDLRAGLSPKVQQLLAFECARARSYYAKARAALPQDDAVRLVAAEIMGAIYSALLRRIEQRDYDVYSEVVRVPRPRRALIAVSVWSRTMLRVGIGMSAAGEAGH